MPRTLLDTPLGRLALWHDSADTLSAARFLDAETPPPDRPSPALAARFADWFAGDLAALDSVAVAPAGSPFQQAVWAALGRIPPGETRSYAEIARALGGGASGPGVNARAVGSANAANPVAIAIPCHRVIGADGRLTGYAGGLWRKAWLLAHEGWAPAQPALL